jgi:hypothetical protein
LQSVIPIPQSLNSIPLLPISHPSRLSPRARFTRTNFLVLYNYSARTKQKTQPLSIVARVYRTLHNSGRRSDHRKHRSRIVDRLCVAVVVEQWIYASQYHNFVVQPLLPKKCEVHSQLITCMYMRTCRSATAKLFDTYFDKFHMVGHAQ